MLKYYSLFESLKGDKFVFLSEYGLAKIETLVLKSAME